jgi:hypothetical protein
LLEQASEQTSSAKERTQVASPPDLDAGFCFAAMRKRQSTRECSPTVECDRLLFHD